MITNKWNGFFIDVEGMDGSGKTTAIKEALRQMDKSYAMEYYKGIMRDNVLGKIVRKIAKTPLFLIELLFTTYFPLRQAMQKGKNVITDKYYFCVASHVPEVKTLTSRIFLKLLEPFMVKPDLIIYFSVSLEERIRRLKAEPYNKFHQRLIDNPEWIVERDEYYVEILKKYARGSLVFVDTTDLNPNEAAQKVKSIIENFLRKRR